MTNQEPPPPPPSSSSSIEPVQSSSSSTHQSTGSPNVPLSAEENSKLLRIWSKNLRFPSAAQPEIIRADQKDAYFINALFDQIEPLLRAAKGSRWVNNNVTRLQDASKLIYLSLTTLPGSQTLGEEYCDIIQFDAFNNTLPALYRRAILIIIEVFSPRLLSKLYERLRQHITRMNDRDSTNNEDHPSSEASHQQRESRLGSLKRKICLWLAYLPSTLDRSTLDSCNALHLSIFYLTGRYFTWSKRFSGITYISDRLRPLRADGLGRESPPSYEILGVLMVIQLVVKVVGTHRQARRRREQLRLASEPVAILDKKESDPKQSNRVLTVDGRLIDEMILEPEDEEEEEEGLDEESDEKDKLDHQKLVDECPEGVLIDDLSDQVTTRRCTLCLGPRKDQTSLECGHLFCWRCLVSWIREKPECPLCRHSVHLAELLPLYNF
ncbi:peroxisome bioproteinsis factor 10 [Puccinia graminis f. sp. tritici]|uniref:RING-type E3 ubiquitin transferase n=2 Tax=Puccinia graminis f. sp. tritici TaxID=56615 RepID=E3JR57_PUCGT|nr:uncharacterized protein PGTG_00679 [Puccinia graminis f. sp. tritici CRL 75-36-700-3]EFP74723.2 hypothetical protein PGTG_00679 [Puccinia graminis f. sp. tritici CRL 75-36-700-3]KAA1114862.1 peroxisome bioproteinsis factor 10 [Puccinia graminis f. sp. tritici]KAA1127044.1 peroxisome bioproteinsis factor 10 [Puccinia graminis f. sp. tritici]